MYAIFKKVRLVDNNLSTVVHAMHFKCTLGWQLLWVLWLKISKYFMIQKSKLGIFFYFFNVCWQHPSITSLFIYCMAMQCSGFFFCFLFVCSFVCLFVWILLSILYYPTIILLSHFSLVGTCTLLYR